MKLNRVESLVVEAMSKANKIWTVDDLRPHFYRHETPPPLWRSSIKARMRTLCLKTLFGPVRVIRVSELGRGRTAQYRIEINEREARRQRAA